MILLIGSHGYIGSAFVAEIERRQLSVIYPARVSYYNPRWMKEALKVWGVDFVINAAAYIPPESVALCDDNPADTIRSNIMLPSMLSQVCEQAGVAFAHISTGCLWNDGLEHSEDDPPQRAFNGHCGFYVGTKVLAEEAVRTNCEKHYIWRLRLPFDEIDHLRNYLSKLARFETVWDHDNTICHRGDFVKACLDLWQIGAEYGTYHVANPGSVNAVDIAIKLNGTGIRTCNRGSVVAGPQGGANLCVNKLLNAGVKIRGVSEALDEAIANWKPNVQTT